MSKLREMIGKKSSGPKFRADHLAIINGTPLEGPREDSCPGPVDVREWTPNTEDRRVWTLLAFHGSALAFWVHDTYRRRLDMRKYQRPAGAPEVRRQFEDPRVKE